LDIVVFGPHRFILFLHNIIFHIRIHLIDEFRNSKKYVYLQELYFIKRFN